MAFKIIREFVPAPMLQMTCDHPRGCGQYAFISLDKAPEGAEREPAVQAQFLQQAASQGWKLGMEHLCPQHHVMERADTSRIVVPTGLLGRVS